MSTLPVSVSGALAAAPGSASPALYTLLGAAITGAVALAGLILKHRWDVAAERRTREEDREKLIADHQYELSRLEHQLSSARASADRDALREVCGRLLAAIHEIYSATADARRERRSSANDAAYRARLAAVPAGPGQAALEEVRLVADERVVAAAEALWEHVRSDEVAMGVDRDSPRWVEWKGRYWQHRSAVISAARKTIRPS